MFEHPIRPVEAACLEDWIRDYRNTADINRRIFFTFTELTNQVPWLKAHRDWVEAHRFGYGQRAFHYLWYLLVAAAGRANEPIRMLEVGVYKGQTISLVGLTGRHLGVGTNITAISPFAGNHAPLSALAFGVRLAFDASFRRAFRVGNLHPVGDHHADCARIFAAFGLDFATVRAVRGLSTDPAVIADMSEREFDVVFIDGDHSFDVARSDIETYTPLVRVGGYAVIDDAGCFLPGRGYFKGMKSVSLACRMLESSPRWQNVLNVGHNRVFRREA